MARRAWLGLGALGVLLLVPFHTPVTLALGIACLVGFVAWGAALIATPQFLAADDSDQER